MTLTAVTNVDNLIGVNPLVDLSSCLGQVERDLLNSEIYEWVIARLQKVLGETSNKAEVWLKGIVREAIRLSFDQFTKQIQLAGNNSSPVQGKTYAAASAKIPLPPPIPVKGKTVNSSSILPASTSTGFTPTLSQDLIDVDSQAISSVEGKNVPHQLKELTNKVSKDLFGSDLEPDQYLPKPKPKKLSKAQKRILALEKTREEKLREVCQIVKQARQKRSISLQQLHKQTLIPLHHLQALENAELDKLPADVYVQGFLRRLADALGLDGASLVSGLPDLTPHRYSCVGSGKNGNKEVTSLPIYLGYTFLMAGAVSGVSWLANQSLPAKATSDQLDVDKATYTMPEIDRNSHSQMPGLQIGEGEMATSAGVQAMPTVSIAIGPDLALPETL